MTAGYECKVCRGPLALLGQLGRLFWLRCIACGLDQSVDSDSMEVERG
jgi:hypothetical protein